MLFITFYLYAFLCGEGFYALEKGQVSLGFVGFGVGMGLARQLHYFSKFL